MVISSISLCVGKTLVPIAHIGSYAIITLFTNVFFKACSICFFTTFFRFLFSFIVSPTHKEIEEMTNYIKKLIQKLYNKENVPVLYGGSITKENISRIKQVENIDGILVGNSSQIVSEFMEIVQKYLN